MGGGGCAGSSGGQLATGGSAAIGKGGSSKTSSGAGKSGGAGGGATTVLSHTGNSVQIIAGGAGGGGGQKNSSSAAGAGGNGGVDGAGTNAGLKGVAATGVGGAAGTGSGSPTSGSSSPDTGTAAAGGFGGGASNSFSGGGGGGGYGGGGGAPSTSGVSPGGGGGGSRASGTGVVMAATGGAGGATVTNAAGKPGTAGSVSFTALSQPANVMAVAGDTTATVTWTNPTQPVSPVNYQVYVKPPGGSFTASGSPVTGSDPASVTVTGLTNGDAYDFHVVAYTSDGLSTTSETSSLPTTSVANTSLPTVSGTTASGHTLTADVGTWSGTPAITYAYQWQTCATSDCAGGGSNISSATDSTFVLTGSQTGSYVRVVVTATNAAGSSSATSAATSMIGTAPTNDSAPELTGTPTSGQTLSTTDGNWSGDPTIAYTYAWQTCTTSNCSGGTVTTIPSAAGSSLALADAQYGLYVRAAVTATNSAGASSQYSNVSARVAAAAPVSTTPAAITGTQADGSTLTVSTGSWTGTPTISYTYQWQTCSAVDCSDGTNIPSATSSTFALTGTQVGTYVRAVVTASNAAGPVTAGSTVTGLIAASAIAPTNDT
ncbi:MAG TPA: hypothetical protein DCQ04_11765, partial [Actinobacteria bacterium]|nr:hypothetical protein [Actinomycetota bacterium]